MTTTPMPIDAAPAGEHSQRYKTFLLRVWAAMLDSYFVAVLPGFLFDWTLVHVDSTIMRNASFLVASFTPAVYHVWMHARFGQTLGKFAVGVRVVRHSDEGPLTLKHALLRSVFEIATSLPYVLYFISFARVGLQIDDVLLADELALSPWMWLGWATMLWATIDVVTSLTNSKRRSIHDLVASTVVVRCPPIWFNAYRLAALLAALFLVQIGHAYYVSVSSHGLQPALQLSALEAAFEKGDCPDVMRRHTELRRQALEITGIHQRERLARSFLQAGICLERMAFPREAGNFYAHLARNYETTDAASEARKKL